MFHEGDIVEIPLPDGRIAIGWILHISKHFKNAIGFIVLGIEGELRVEDVETAPTLDVLGPIYTHVAAPTHYGWRVIAHQPISPSKRLLTKRRVGGDVYVGDDYLGAVEELDGERLRSMVTMGMPVVYKEIETAFAKREDNAREENR